MSELPPDMEPDVAAIFGGTRPSPQYFLPACETGNFKPEQALTEFLNRAVGGPVPGRDDGARPRLAHAPGGDRGAAPHLAAPGRPGLAVPEAFRTQTVAA